MGRTQWLKNRDVHPSAAIALSKLATGALPSGITVNTDNLTTGGVATGDIADDAVTYDKLDAETVQMTATTITAAQVANLSTTALAITPVPGAGKAIVMEGVRFFLDYSGGAFGNVAAGDVLELSLSATPANTLGAQANGVGFLDQTADQVLYVRCTTAEPTLTANAAVFVGLGGAVTKDSSTSELKVRAYYRVVPTTA